MGSFLLAIIYLSFISLGLPDAALGAAWPVMHPQMGVPVSYMGAVSILISGSTIVASLLSDRLTRRFGTGKVTAVSVLMTALALFGFSVSRSYWMLLLLAVPYGLGAGGVDASLNNYVALHYASRHMSWLHCMWSLGAATGPYIMGYALTAGQGWPMGYRYLGIIQIVLTLVLFWNLPKWKKPAWQQVQEEQTKVLSLRQILSIPGAKAVLLTFICYCAIEQTLGSWASSYFVMRDGVSEEEAASLAGVFYIGITIGRFLSGFATMRFNNTQMVRLGQGIMGAGVVIMLLPFGKTASVIGLVLIGLGGAPIFPCIIHSTPEHFGPENAQAVIGVQMASAYVGILAAPPVFGILAEHISMHLLPFFTAAILIAMVLMHERLVRISRDKHTKNGKT